MGIRQEVLTSLPPLKVYIIFHQNKGPQKQFGGKVLAFEEPGQRRTIGKTRVNLRPHK